MDIKTINKYYDEIVEDAEKDNQKAKTVLHLGTIYNNFKEPCAEALLKQSFTDWHQSKYGKSAFR